MAQSAFRFGIGVFFLVALLGPAPGQDAQRPQFYKTPETAAEFWRAMNHEIELGQYKLAAQYLKSFLGKNPTDEELLQIHEREGSSAFLRLLTIPELRAQAKPLVERADAVVQKHLADPKRLEAMIKTLTTADEPEQRNYALTQLRRAGAAAVPALIGAVVRTAEIPEEHARLLEALTRLDRTAVPPMLAALDFESNTLRAELIDVMNQRGEVSAAPFLWYPSAATEESSGVRVKARETLAKLLGVRPDQLPTAKIGLTQEAERYYRHQVRFADPVAVQVWRWDGQNLVLQPMPATDAEEYYGLRFARQALRLDPSYVPAQIVFLSTALDKAMGRTRLDPTAAKGSASVRELAASVNPELLIAVLERALDDKRLPVILAATRALGELGDPRAGQASPRREPVLVRALNYPDRRVQMAAADAILRLPRPVAAGRVVEVLARLAGADVQPKVLIADPNADRAHAVARALQSAGFAAVLANTGRQAFARLGQAADIDLVLVDRGIVDPMLAYFLTQLRADVDAGRLPVLVTAAPEQVDSIQLQVNQFPNVLVIPETTNPATLKEAYTARSNAAFGQPLSDAERKDYAARSMEWLARIARGELPGYNAQPAEAAILKGLRNKDLAPLAVLAAGWLPGANGQRELATTVLDTAQPAELRSAAAVELSRNIQRNGLTLAGAQVQALQGLFDATSESKLKGNLALVLGSMHPDARLTGLRLQRYTPSVAAPAPAPAPAKEQKGATSDE